MRVYGFLEQAKCKQAETITSSCVAFVDVSGYFNTMVVLGSRESIENSAGSEAFLFARVRK